MTRSVPSFKPVRFQFLLELACNTSDPSDIACLSCRKTSVLCAYFVPIFPLVLPPTSSPAPCLHCLFHSVPTLPRIPSLCDPAHYPPSTRSLRLLPFAPPHTSLISTPTLLAPLLYSRSLYFPPAAYLHLQRDLLIHNAIQLPFGYRLI